MWKKPQYCHIVAGGWHRIFEKLTAETRIENMELIDRLLSGKMNNIRQTAVVVLTILCVLILTELHLRVFDYVYAYKQEYKSRQLILVFPLTLIRRS